VIANVEEDKNYNRIRTDRGDGDGRI